MYEEESIYSSEETDEDNNIVNKNEDIQIDHNENKKVKKRVTFFDSVENYNPDTFCVHFSHSENSSYNTETKSIFKAPSDIYHHFPEYFQKKPKSIIKNSNKVKNEKHTPGELIQNSSDNIATPVSASIILGNIVERKDDPSNTNNLPAPSEQKPMSKFKSMRLQQKKNG